MKHFFRQQKGVGLVESIIGLALGALTIYSGMTIMEIMNKDRQNMGRKESMEKTMDFIEGALNAYQLCQRNFSGINPLTNEGWSTPKKIFVQNGAIQQSLLEVGASLDRQDLTVEDIRFSNFAPFAPPGSSALASQGTLDLEVYFKSGDNVYRRAIPLRVSLQSGDPAFPEQNVLNNCFAGDLAVTPACSTPDQVATYATGGPGCAADAPGVTIATHYQRVDMPCEGNVGLPDDINGTLDPSVASYQAHRNIFGANCSTTALRAGVGQAVSHSGVTYGDPTGRIYGFDSRFNVVEHSGKRATGFELLLPTEFDSQAPIFEYEYVAKLNGTLSVHANVPAHGFVRDANELDSFGHESAFIGLLYYRAGSGPWTNAAIADLVNLQSSWGRDPASTPHCQGDLSAVPPVEFPCAYGSVGVLRGSFPVTKGVTYTIRINAISNGDYMRIRSYDWEHGQNADGMVHFGTLKFLNYNSVGYLELTEIQGGPQ